MSPPPPPHFITGNVYNLIWLLDNFGCLAKGTVTKLDQSEVWALVPDRLQIHSTSHLRKSANRTVVRSACQLLVPADTTYTMTRWLPHLICCDSIDRNRIHAAITLGFADYQAGFPVPFSYARFWDTPCLLCWERHKTDLDQIIIQLDDFPGVHLVRVGAT